jgi:MYXO-CTERM domain-containing protein
MGGASSSSGGTVASASGGMPSTGGAPANGNGGAHGTPLGGGENAGCSCAVAPGSATNPLVRLVALGALALGFTLRRRRGVLGVRG